MQSNFQLLWKCVVLKKIVSAMPVNKCQTFMESESYSYVRRTVFWADWMLFSASHMLDSLFKTYFNIMESAHVP